MKTHFVLLLLVVGSFSSYAQKSNTENTVLVTEIKKESKAMADAFIKEDYKAFVKFTHPTLMQLMGGESKMIATLTKTINDVKNQGVSFLNITFDNPTKIIKIKNELQCTIEQHLTAKVPNGNTTNSSTLIAVSLDNGKKWFFIDTTNKDISQIKKVFPNLSPEIIINKKV
jgi:hypothetical protein